MSILRVTHLVQARKIRIGLFSTQFSKDPLVVMAGRAIATAIARVDPAIHVFASPTSRRGCPAQAGHDDSVQPELL
jgi:hypothetical protein